MAPPNVLLRIAATATILAASASMPTGSAAQTNPPRYILDQNNVDLATGYFTFGMTDVAIGPPGAGGLSYTRFWSFPRGWRTSESDEFVQTTNKAWVNIQGVSIEFNRNGNAYTPVEARGQTLSANLPYYDYTEADGTVYRFSGIPGPRQVLKSIIAPNGDVTLFNYVLEYVQEPDPIDPEGPWTDLLVTRLQSISNNRGYQIRFQYKSDEVANPGLNADWFVRIGATGFNMAVEACDPMAPSCSYSQTWPTISYGLEDHNPFHDYLFTDGLGRVTRVRFEGGLLKSLQYPSSATPDVIVNYAAFNRVSSVTVGADTWNYTYTDFLNNRTSTITDPLSRQWAAGVDLARVQVVARIDPLGRITGYSYDASNRLISVTLPEGQRTELTYDTRGNVIQARQIAEPGTGLADIVTSATYEASCTNPKVCNQPLTTTDPRGAVTDYTYDPAHGGVTSVTAPAPTGGAVRPQARIDYAPRYAWYKSAAGTMVQALSPVTLPAGSSACAAGASCPDSADELRTTITYGAAGVANNLLPTVIASGSGDGALIATTTLTHSGAGDVASLDGPLPGVQDRTLLRHDSERQLLGMVGPDPDGGGVLKHRAVRYSYDADGLPTMVEQGTVDGYGDGDWSAFVSLQQVVATYDDIRRPVRSALTAGGQTYAVGQVTYDAAGQVDCLVERMNPASFGALPASACTATAVGVFGPDRITRLSYSPAGEATAVTTGWGHPDAITEAATYTPNGLPETLTDGAGNVSTMVYDGFDRLSRTRYPNPTGGGSSTTDYEETIYDQASNPVSRRTRAGQVFTVAYDALNRPVQVTAPAGADSIAHVYDNLGRPLSATIAGGGATTLTWDALNRQTTETGPLGAVASRYDLAGRRTRLTWPDAFFVTYDHDLYGAVTAVRENGASSGPGVLASYDYDNLGRRTAIHRGNGVSTSYGHDPASRLTSLSHNLSGTAADLSLTLAHSPAAQITNRAASNAAYSWTGGAAGATAYVNDGLNRVISAGGAAITYDANQNITATGAGGFGYNAYDQLTSASAGPGAVLAYDALGRLSRTVSGSTTARFLYDGVQAIGEYDSAGGLVRRHVPGPAMDETVISYAGAGTANRQWLLTDERGSVIALADAAGAATAINTYDEYGRPGPANAGRFQYTGQMWLPEVGLYHYKARAYDPGLGRFMQPDPAGYAAGMNLYAYVGGDPINLIDPLGLQEEEASSCDELRTTNCVLILPEVVSTARRAEASASRRRGGGLGFGYMPRVNPVQDTAEYRVLDTEVERVSAENAWMAEPILAVMPSGQLGRLGRVAPAIARACNCFVAGTDVLTAAGARDIETLEVGDLVLSRDETTGETALKPVVALIAGSDRQIWEVVLETVDAEGTARRETFGTTDEHPWRLVGGDWAETAELYPGAQLVTASGAPAAVVSVGRTARVERTFNVEVADFHTYFVGEGGVWVHNTCRPYDFPRNVKTIIRNLMPNCANCGVRTISGVRDVRGVSPSPVRSEIHHRVPGVGRDVPDGVNLCRECHRLEHAR